MNRYANPTGRYQRIEFGATVARVTTLRRGSFEAHTNSFVLDEIIDLAKAKIRDDFEPHLPLENYTAETRRNAVRGNKCQLDVEADENTGRETQASGAVQASLLRPQQGSKH
jgi:hypothetical protein